MKSQASKVPHARLSAQVPRRWRHDLSGILIRETAVNRRVRSLARQIEMDYQDRDLVVIALLKGTVLFLADLVRYIRSPLRLAFIGVSSYRQGVRRGRLVVTQKLEMDLNGRDVLIVDDILDTGCTLTSVIRMTQRHRPASLRVCVLLDKPTRRTHPVDVHYVGFEIPDHFVVGYGMDFEERFRNLPFVGVLKQSASAEPTARV